MKILIGFLIVLSSSLYAYFATLTEIWGFQYFFFGAAMCHLVMGMLVVAKQLSLKGYL